MTKKEKQADLFPGKVMGMFTVGMKVTEAREVLANPLRFGDELQVAADLCLQRLATAKQAISRCVDQDHMLTSERCPRGCLDFLPVYFRRVALEEFWADVEKGKAE